VLLSLRVRDLLLASWEADPAQVTRTLPSGLGPATVDDRALVSLAAFRYAGGRLGPVPVPAFSQLNARVYVMHEGEPAVFFLAARVTWPGMGGALLGAPFRPARIRVRRGAVAAPGLGVSLAYEVKQQAEPSELTHHRVGLFEAAGVRAFRVGRSAADWRRAEPRGEAHADLLVALGFELAGPPALLYAPRAEFRTELPPRRVR
jgi:uncharacterized protein YqjF (DUF2071 family)